MKWLESLEKRARAAIAELERLREENARLAGRVEELETQVRHDASSDWTEERDAIRKRVQKLVDRLEKLVE